MEIIVCKFGGTSTATSDRFRQIRRILESDPRRRYAVLSAPGAAGEGAKVTDLLYRLWLARDSGGEAERLAGAVAERFQAIAGGLGLPDPTPRVRAELEEAVQVSLARTVSRGEALCAALFSAYIGWPMVDAAEVIRFDGGGQVDVPATLAALGGMAERYPRAVLPGFYGAQPDGRIALMPRNGSDITGALAAAGVGASLYENWTDVPGLMTDDPAIRSDARLIPSISYAEMRRLALAGARVLHPDCLRPVEEAGIPTRIRCTMDPDAPGTLINVME